MKKPNARSLPASGIPPRPMRAIDIAAVIVRNAIPIVGIVAIGWSAVQFLVLTVFNLALSIVNIGLAGVSAMTLRGDDSEPPQKIGFSDIANFLDVGLFFAAILTALGSWPIFIISGADSDLLMRPNFWWSALAMVIASLPSVRAEIRLERHLQVYPPGHPLYTPTVEERLKRIQATTLGDAASCYRDLLGATGSEFVAVGDFDPQQLSSAIEELFGSWRSPYPFARVPQRYFDRPALEDVVATPDKANAVLRGGENVKMRDDDPDFPALLLANYLLGGSSTARLPARIREKEGLSYSTYSGFVASQLDPAASFRVAAIFGPQNRARVEQAMREEIERAVRDGFGADEVEAGKKALLEARRLQRSQDRALAARLSLYAYVGRTFTWDIDLESKIAKLTPQEVSAALRKYIDPAKLAIVTAGDFKK